MSATSIEEAIRKIDLIELAKINKKKGYIHLRIYPLKLFSFD